MKSMILAVLLVASSSIDLAQAQTTKWIPLSNSMYVMQTNDDDHIHLMASIDSRDNKLSFSIMDLTGTVCKEDGSVTEPEKFPPIKINGKYVRVLSMCINGSRLIAPETPDGRIYFHDQIQSGKLVTIEIYLGPSPILHFEGALPSDLLKKLLESENAM